MARAFKLSNGRYGLHPDDRDESIRIRHRFYTTDTKCSTCGISSLRLTHSNNCMLCQRIKIEIVRYYSQYNDDDIHIVPWPDNVDDKFCDDDFMKELSEYRRLIRDEGLMLHSEPCKKHGHVRLGHDCYCCGQMDTPRNEAIERSEATYIATGECASCDQVTMRNTIDKSCTKCGYVPQSKLEPSDTPDMIMMRQNPDMIVSKVDADEYGFKVYRTGDECHKGHSGWRYVSTGNCIMCIKGE